MEQEIWKDINGYEGFYQKLWEMAKVITDKQKAAKESPTDKVDWNMLEEMWFDWLEEELFEKDFNIKSK